MRFALLGQKDMLFLLWVGGDGNENGTPERQVVLQHRYEAGRKGQVKDVGMAALASDFEFVATEGEPPLAVDVAGQVLSQPHFSHVPLAVGNIRPETKHQGVPGADSIDEPWHVGVASVVIGRSLAWPERSAYLVQGGKRDPGIGFVIRRRRHRNGFFECDDLVDKVW
jgi:hypothetical protein